MSHEINNIALLEQNNKEVAAYMLGLTALHMAGIEAALGDSGAEQAVFQQARDYIRSLNGIS